VDADYGQGYRKMSSEGYGNEDEGYGQRSG
jgi:hypothetical protein